MFLCALRGAKVDGADQQAGRGAFHCCDDVAFGADQQRVAVAFWFRGVEAEHERLVRNGVGSCEHEFLRAVRGGGTHEVDDEVGAQPRQVAADFGEPRVVADREPEAAEPWQVHRREAGAGGVLLIGTPWADLAVCGGKRAVWRVNGHGVEHVAGRILLTHGAGNQPHAQLLGELGEVV